MNKYLRNKKVKMSFREEIEPHEVFLDKLSQEKEDDFKEKFEVPLSQKKILTLKIIFLILFLVVLGKTFQLQVLEGQKFLSQALENKERSYQIRAPRGIIYDKKMNRLVFNKPAYDLICDKRDLPRTEIEKVKIIEEVAEILNEDKELILKTINEAEFSVIPISENLPHQILVVLETRIKGLTGFRVEENTVRYYPDEGLSHLIGYTARISKEELKINPDYFITDYIGKAGLEETYEKILRGRPGEVLVEKDALGKKRSQILVSESEAGKSLVLNFDKELQEKIIAELKKSLKRVGVRSAAAVAIDPNTGGVLSLVSLPDFNNNLFSQGISQEEWKELEEDENDPLFNRVISGWGYPTGSVIKPLIGVAALEEGIITENTKIYCPLEICVWNRYLQKEECFSDWTFHGTSDIKRGIAESVNTFFYQIGGGYKDFQGLGAEKIIKYLKLFNWGEKTGIDLAEEGKGILPEITKSWHLGDTYHLSIGQGPFTATPIEVGAGFVAIANRGRLFEPRLVQKIIDGSSGSLVEEIKPRLIREIFVDSQNIEIIRDGMRQAVTSGSAISLNDLPVKAAAKTGTAQSSKEGYYHHWICVFAPYENPQIVLTIIIEDIKGIQSATLPVAKEVLRWYFTHSSHEAENR